MQPHQFELLGGHPALDFLNTVPDWTAAPDKRRDNIPDSAAALRFAEQAGMITRADARAIGRIPGPEMTRLRELRDLLERIFRAVSQTRPADAADLEALARDAAAAADATTLSRREGVYVRRIDPKQAGAATLRFRIVDAAVALLTAPAATLERIKACPACGWLFRDETKSATRKWCSMATCGSTAKSRSYYWRTKAESE